MSIFPNFFLFSIRFNFFFSYYFPIILIYFNPTWYRKYSLNIFILNNFFQIKHILIYLPGYYIFINNKDFIANFSHHYCLILVWNYLFLSSPHTLDPHIFQIFKFSIFFKFFNFFTCLNFLDFYCFLTFVCLFIFSRFSYFLVFF